MSQAQAKTASRQEWKGASIATRLAVIHKMFILHKSVRALFEYIDCQLVINAARGSADGALVIAQSGAGKTHTINQLQLMYPDCITPTLTRRPVVTLLIPKSPNANSLGAALLKALGDPAYRAGNAQEKFERIEVLLNAVEARVIAIDNFQDIPARRRIRGISEIGDWFRDLCSMKFPGVILAFGTEEAAIVRDSSTQLRRRMQARFELPVFSIETPTDVKRWKWLLGEIDLRLPMAEDSNLNESKMAVRIAVACGGNFDYLMKLLEKAMMSAVNRGSERIEMEDLLKGFDTQHQVSAEGGNPFKEDFTSTRLNLPGQIFHNPSEDDDSSSAKDRPASNRNATKRT